MRAVPEIELKSAREFTSTIAAQRPFILGRCIPQSSRLRSLPPLQPFSGFDSQSKSHLLRECLKCLSQSSGIYLC